MLRLPTTKVRYPQRPTAGTAPDTQKNHLVKGGGFFLKMVGLVRFEANEPPKQIAEWQLHNSPSMKTHDKKPEKNAQIDSLRLQLTEADNQRRALLVSLFFAYQHDTGPIIKTLFSEASRETLQTVEYLLWLDIPKEGGK